MIEVAVKWQSNIKLMPVDKRVVKATINSYIMYGDCPTFYTQTIFDLLMSGF